jgi:DNA replication protein DnaC
MSQEESNIRQFSVVPKSGQGAAGYVAEEPCPVCFGAGLEVVPGEGARLCQCRIAKSKEHHLDRLNIPKRHADCHFHNYNAEHQSQKTAYKMASELAFKYPAVDRGLLLMGTVGVGKTHLAVSILKALSEKGISSYFCEFGTMLKQIQDSYNPISHNTELQLLTPLFESEVLVLDELGASKPSDWMRDTLSHIINTRYNDKKLTIFTTNYLDKRYHSEEILAERIGERLRSRLYEMCRTITIVGDDYRKNFDKSSAAKKKNTSDSKSA